MTPRPYTMRVRADALARTREQIIAAALALTEETLSLELTLDAVAQRAGVGVRTVLRHFGSRDGLFDAVFAAGQAAVEAEREAPAGDVETALAALLEQYERRGDFTAHLLGQEGSDPRVDRLLSDRARRAPPLGRRRVRPLARSAAGGRRGQPDRPAGRRHRRLHLEAATPRPRAVRGRYPATDAPTIDALLTGHQR